MPLKRPTTTPMPDEIFDEWAPLLGKAELKVLLYIVRRTLGFRKCADAISLTQFTDGIVTRDGRVLDRGSGITSRHNVISALKSLEEKGLIRARPGQTAAGDHAVTVYALWWEGDDTTGSSTRGSSVPEPPGGSATALRWYRGDHEVVPQQNHGSVAVAPTTNSLSTNSQQDSMSTRTSTRAERTDERRDHAHDGAHGTESSRDSVDPLWQEVLDDLRESMTADNYATWFTAARAEPRTGPVLTVQVPTAMHAQWLDTKLRSRVEQALRRLGQSDIQIVFQVAP